MLDASVFFVTLSEESVFPLACWMRVIVYASRIDGNHARGPDGAFQKKRSLGKMGWLKRMGLHILTLDGATHLTVVLVYV